MSHLFWDLLLELEDYFPLFHEMSPYLVLGHQKLREPVEFEGVFFSARPLPDMEVRFPITCC